MRREDAGWSRDRAGRQGRTAQARRDEALDGSAHPSLQALHRRLPGAGRRGIRGGGSAEGRIRRVSRVRRHEQALSREIPRAVLRASAGDGFHVQGPHAGRCVCCSGLDRHRLRGDRPVIAASRKIGGLSIRRTWTVLWTEWVFLLAIGAALVWYLSQQTSTREWIAYVLATLVLLSGPVV